MWVLQGGSAQGGNKQQFANTHGLMGQPGSAGSVMPVVKTKLANMVTVSPFEAPFALKVSGLWSSQSRCGLESHETMSLESGISTGIVRCCVWSVELCRILPCCIPLCVGTDDGGSTHVTDEDCVGLCRPITCRRSSLKASTVSMKGWTV